MSASRLAHGGRGIARSAAQIPARPLSSQSNRWWHGRRTHAGSRELNYFQADWEAHRSPWRYIGLLPLSDTFAGTVPSLARIALNGGCLTYYNEVMLAGSSPLYCPPPVLAMPTLALGLLVTFRTNASYQRFDKGRLLWGELINTSRNLGRMALQWLPGGCRTAEPAAQTPVDTPQPRQHSAEDVLMLLKAYSITLRFHLTSNGNHYDLQDGTQIELKLREELRATGLSQKETESCCATNSRPLWVLQRLGTSISEGSRGMCVEPILHAQMDAQVQKLTDVLGGCERILRTPLPTTYTRHTSRFLFIWAHTVPWVLYPVTGLATVPCSMFVAWALLGIEDAGVRLEEPFSVLPLWQYSKAVDDGVEQLKSNHD